MNLNKVMLIGNVTRDPEVKTTPQGQTVATFSIATNSTWKDAQGNKQERVEYHNIVAWRKLAEIIGQYVKKGSKMYLEGKLQTRDWQGQDGVKKYRTEVVADNMIMLDRAGSAPMGGAAKSTPSFPGSNDLPTIEQEAPMPTSSNDEINIEEIPF
jgi:single-strand DNA-binding protein